MIRRVLVTGASRGIGRACAELLLAAGREVAAIARDTATVPEGARPIGCDLSDPAATRSAIGRAVEALGGLDGLIHCAGHADHRPLADLDEATIDAHFAVHARAPLILARDLAAHLGERTGAIVLVASTLALQGVPGTAAYAAAKGAVIAMTRTLAIELAPRVRVSCVAPGGVDTELVAARAKELAALHPIGRIAAPVEIASTIVHLLDASFVTGSVVTVDGGLTAR